MSEIKINLNTPKNRSIIMQTKDVNRMLNSQFPHIEEDFTLYENHVKSLIQNPTGGLLTKHKYIDENIYSPDKFKRNIQIMDSDKEIKKLKLKLNDNLSKMYPKTLNLRKKIIDSDRVVIDSVKPVEKGFVPKLVKKIIVSMYK